MRQKETEQREEPGGWTWSWASNYLVVTGKGGQGSVSALKERDSGQDLPLLLSNARWQDAWNGRGYSNIQLLPDMGHAGRPARGEMVNRSGHVSAHSRITPNLRQCTEGLAQVWDVVAGEKKNLPTDVSYVKSELRDTEVLSFSKEEIVSQLTDHCSKRLNGFWIICSLP